MKITTLPKSHNRSEALNTQFAYLYSSVAAISPQLTGPLIQESKWLLD